MVGSHPVVCATAGLDDGRGGAGTPDGAVSGTGGRTNDSARPSVGADPPRPLRRSRSPPSRASANHRLATGVNHDASLFCSAPDSGLVARHGGGALRRYCGSAVRRTSASGDGPAGRNLRRNRFGRGRNSYRSRPACGSPRRGTAAPTPPRHERAERQVDLRHDCRDIGPACVPGTGVRHGVELKPPSSDLGAVLAPQEASLTCQPPSRQPAAMPAGWCYFHPPNRKPQRTGPLAPGGRRPTFPGRAPSVGLRPPFSPRPGNLLT